MTTNRRRVTEGFEILTGALAPWVAAVLRARYEDEWWDQGVRDVLDEQQRRGLPEGGEDGELIAALDIARCLFLMDVQWNDIFRRRLSREHRTWVDELKATRDRWAHKGLVDTADDDARRALDTMTRLVERIDAEAAERLRALAQAVRYGTEGPSASAPADKRAETSPRAEEEDEAGADSGVLAAVPRRGLRPWREIARPHPDVAAGRYRQAEFAADLAQVVRGAAATEYQDPVEFFARTYMTVGLRGLLTEALRRIDGLGGEPIVQLKTSFGGGKTHSLLALFHLLAGRAPLESLPHVSGLLDEAGVGRRPRARVAVLVGTALDPAKERRPPHLPGIAVRTLWGEIAAQLVGQTGNRKLYDLVRAADRKGAPPGSDALRTLFDACGPCLILIDELVAYARKIYGVDGLPAGSFDALQTFVQELTEAVRASRGAVLVTAVPESDIEIGSEAGRRTLERIAHIFGRMESIWKPIGSEEGFEVVRRRLFLPIENLAARNYTCRAFGSLYRHAANEFPAECRERRYEERMRACYPIHPETFDRLYGDWAALERFQRTRGVLRLMAAAIHDLWERNDASLLIMPGGLGLDSMGVREELARYLPEGWTAVLETDVDGRNSGPLRLDRRNPRFGQKLAARRVARTIFLGSAPHAAGQSVRGLEDVRARLGAAQPGERISLFNDALSQLSDRLTHLHRRDRRYWYDTKPNLRRTVEERARQLSQDAVAEEIGRRLREAARGERGDFRGVHVCPATSADVPDERTARLVALRPGATHKAGDAESAAIRAAREILENRGKTPRRYRNMLVFLAADSGAMEGLEQEVRQFLAWRSVREDEEALNLDAHQRRDAAQGAKDSDRAARARFDEAWRWTLSPAQYVENDKVGALEWDAAQTSGNGDSVVARAARRAKADERLVGKWAPALLRMELDRWFWKDKDKKEVPLRQAWEALASYCYLPRLRDEAVLLDTVRSGAADGESFGYADRATDGRYEGLKLGAPAAARIDDASVLVKPEAARAQIEAERQTRATPRPNAAAGVAESDRGRGAEPHSPPPETLPPPPPLRRFYGNIEIDADKPGRDITQLTEEILRHLTTLPGGRVKVTVAIQANIPEGVPPDVRRALDENCRTLGFGSHGFEKE